MFCSLFLAASFTLKLPCVGGAQETYFLPLDMVRADAATLTLKGPDATDVPFSLDARVDVPSNWPGLKRRFDGFYSHYSFPIGQSDCRRLGWLSFRAPVGVSEVTLAFETGEAPTGERKNASVRTWWVDLLKKDVVTEPDGYRLAGTRVIRRDEFVDIAAMAGRRLVTYMRMRAPEGTPDSSCFSVCLPNAAKSTPNANAGYFGVPREGCDFISEGFVRTEGPVTFTSRDGAFVSSSYKAKPDARPLVVCDFKIQSAPHVEFARVRVQSDLFNTGDTIEIVPPQARGEVLVPFEAAGLVGARAWTFTDATKVTVESVLRDKSGRVWVSGNGTSLALKGVPAGEYTLCVTLFVEGVRLVTSEIQLTVQSGPWRV